MLPKMCFMLVAIVWMHSQSTRESLCDRILWWIIDMILYRYPITGLLSSMEWNEWIRYENWVKSGVKRCFYLIPQWNCVSWRSLYPFCLFFVQVMQFWILCPVNLVSTLPSFELIYFTPALQAPVNICVRHSMVKRVLGGEKRGHWCISNPVPPYRPGNYHHCHL